MGVHHHPSRFGNRIQTLGLACLLAGGLFPGAVPAQDWHYRVRPGDTLWDITAEHLTRMEYWPRLQRLNQVADPQRLPPGSQLRIPVGWLKRLPTQAQILSVQGEAQVAHPARPGRTPVSVGQSLESDDILYTGPDGTVTLAFGDGSRLLVQANSELQLTKLRAYGATNLVDTVLRLLQGRVESRVTPRPATGPRYEISTPAATSVVRGTHYRLALDGTRATARAEVLEGSVAVQGRQRTRTVNQGFGALAEAGQAPRAPVPLLAPPDTAGLPPVITRAPIQLALPELTGAVRYRVQIAANDRFETLLFDGVTAPPGLRGPDLPDGDYVLRLRGVDAQDLEGRDALHPFRLHARPEPPFLMHPPHQGAVLENALHFEWSEPERAAAYHFQLASDESFAAPLLDSQSSKTRLEPERPLSPGQYYWRVAVRDDTGRVGPFSDPQWFRLQPTPKLQPPEVTADQLTFRWSAGPPGQRYEFQLARDAGFEEVLISRQVAEPQLTLPRPPSGFHYLRIRSIEPEGYQGPYGPVQRIDVPPASYWPVGLVLLLTLILVP